MKRSTTTLIVASVAATVIGGLVLDYIRNRKQ